MIAEGRTIAVLNLTAANVELMAVGETHQVRGGKPLAA